jgi:hypothetical protein
MINVPAREISGRLKSVAIAVVVFATWVTTGASFGLAQQSPQRTFQSAAEASQSLFDAIQRDNQAAIASILGCPKDLLTSGEEVKDTTDRALFVQKYQEMHRLGREANGTVVLYIGAENWPFPIPLVEKVGAWRFDPDAGQKEVLFRRIGENELTAIATCHEFVAAEKRYQAEPTIASLVSSSPESLVAKAASGSASGDPVRLSGYYFRIVATHPPGGNRRGGFVLIAYPAEYRVSGVMTFVVRDNDVVYEKDLGANTSALATAMAAFHKDATWRAAEE